MFIIQKKRIQIIILCVLIGIFTFTIENAKDNNQEIEKEKSIIETTATPVSGKTIIVDAGHGSPDEGAESSNRNNRSKNKLTNSSQTSKFARNKWKYSSFNTFR